MMETRDIDVSELAAPEPMQVILSELAILPKDMILKVTHSRQPWPLYERLVDNGWLYECDVINDDAVIIYIANEGVKKAFIKFWLIKSLGS